MFLHWFPSPLGSLIRGDLSWSSVYRRQLARLGNFIRSRRSRPARRSLPEFQTTGRSLAFSLLFLALALTACNNENISVYRIPKENNQVSMQTGSGNLAPPPPTNPASWTKPDSWTEKTLSEMRLGSFEVAGANGESADISITAFPGDAGGLDSNINRWREQVHQTALESEQLAQTWQEETVDGVPTIIVDLQSPAGAEKVSAILGAVLRTADRTWFVKMTGSPDLLKTQKDNFLHFVRSFHFPTTGQPQKQEEPPPSNVKSTNDR
jgi:hypothetical protein